MLPTRPASRRPVPPARRTVAGLALLAACGVQGGTLVLDEATVSARLEQIATVLPGCDATTVTTAARRLHDVGPGLGVVLSTLSPVALQGPHKAGSGSSGACGGQVVVDSAHESGVTDYTVSFEQFCMTSADGDVVLDGTVIATQIGTPSDDGPVISALEASTDGPLAMSHGGDTHEIELDALRTDYGNPAAWAPDPGDDAHPDVTTVTRMTIAYASGDVDYIEDVRFESTGGDGTTVEFVDGRLGREGEPFVTLRTPPDDPLTFAPLGVQLTGGTLELGGANGTVLAASVDPEAPGTFVLELNGEVLDQQLDCTEGREPFLQAAIAILAALPL